MNDRWKAALAPLNCLLVFEVASSLWDCQVKLNCGWKIFFGKMKNGELIRKNPESTKVRTKWRKWAWKKTQNDFFLSNNLLGAALFLKDNNFSYSFSLIQNEIEFFNNIIHFIIISLFTCLPQWKFCQEWILT